MIEPPSELRVVRVHSGALIDGADVTVVEVGVDVGADPEVGEEAEEGADATTAVKGR
ncbi:MAG TPA: hypothetical protein VJ935_04515 [Acidimicrobiia bacterium]|nr:hypothetical protein [Acidimicrobiia bacterium]